MDEQKHNETKKKIRIIGIVLLVIGIALVITGVIGFINTFLSAQNGEVRFPTLFFLIVPGAPMAFAGLALVLFSYKREIGTYVKNESVPVINEAADELKPAVKSVVSAVREGIKSEDTHTVTCPKCGVKNPAGHSFCPECGEPLVKTCPQCGAQQEADDKFCGKCGAKFE